MSKGKFDANIQLLEMALAEISWWKENINSASNDIDAQSRHGEPDFIIFWTRLCQAGELHVTWDKQEATGLSQKQA